MEHAAQSGRNRIPGLPLAQAKNETAMHDCPAEAFSRILRRRRAIYPAQYDSDRPIPAELVTELLEDANQAPTHRHTEPWRFVVFHGPASRRRLGEWLAEWYRTHTSADAFSEKKYEKTLRKPLLSGCVLAIAMQRDPQARVPEWEELAAVACAVENLWLSATARGLGGYWSTPPSIHDLAAWLQLPEGQRCVGLFYLGWPREGMWPEGKRSPVEEKVTWFEE